MTNRRPNLFIVGAPKCGTTAWVHYLDQHAGIYFCKPKEPHFFNTDMPNFRWFRSESEYLRLFQASAGASVVGEASVMYLYSTEAAANIARFAPDAKILIFIRRHGPFIASYHQQMLYNRDENEPDLATAWRLSGARNSPPHCRDDRFLDYKSAGLFAEQIARYLAHFPAEQVKVISFEAWTANPRDAYLEILDFLGLDDDGRVDFAKMNSAHRHRWPVLADLTQRPPSFLLAASKLAKKLPGFRTFRPGHALRKLNRAEGYSAKPSALLMEEIERHYAEDRDRTRELISITQECPQDEAW